MQTPDEMIAAIEAFKRNEKIQYRRHGMSDWIYPAQPDWNFDAYEYRAVPKPKEIWVNEYPSGTGYVAHQSQENALKSAGNNIIRAVRYIEADPQ